MKYKRAKKLDDVTETGVMTLDEVVNHLQASHIPLCYLDDNRVEPWATKKQSMPFRRAIYKHNPELHNLIMAGDARLCVNPALHRASWEMREGVCVCAICQRLDRHIYYGEALAEYHRQKDEQMEALEVQAEKDLARLKENDVLRTVLEAL